MDKSILEKFQDPNVENHYNMTSTNAQYPAPKHGGYVSNIKDGDSFTIRPYKMYADGKPILNDNLRFDMVGHLHSETPLNKIFFSSENVDYIQKQIQSQVNAMSGGKYNIDRQNDDDVKIIMRSYYLMFGQNDPNFVERELHELNSRVIGYAAAKVYSEVEFHMFYLNDIQDFAPPIANPMNPHVFGTRTGELRSFF